jgi:isopentenyldiphosphate isomerase
MAKAEKLEIFDLDGHNLGVQDRKELYQEMEKEFDETGKITKQVKSIRVLVMNSKGKIYIQHRSEHKDRNPSKYDKTIGGHVTIGHSWDLSVVKECHEELGFPGIVLNDDEFRAALPATNLKIIGLLRKVEHVNNFVSINSLKNKTIKQPFITTFYIGYYDGPISFCDGEATGIEVVSAEDLQRRMDLRPDEYTEDLKFMIKRFASYLVPITAKNKPLLGYEE